MKPYEGFTEADFAIIKFAIHKLDIIKHPISRYQNLLAGVERHSNPEVGHYFERSWCAVFHPLKNTNVIKYNKL